MIDQREVRIREMEERYDKVKAAIEEKFGGPLEWQRLDEKITCRIRIDRDLKYIEQDQRQQVIEFLTTASGKLMEVFTPYSLKYSKK